MNKLIKNIKYTEDGKIVKRNKFNYAFDSLKTEILINKNIIIYIDSKTDYEVSIVVNNEIVKKELFDKNTQSLNIDIPLISMDSFVIEIENMDEKEEIIILNSKGEINYKLNVKKFENYGLRYLKYFWNEENTWNNIIKDLEVLKFQDMIEVIIDKKRKDDLESLKELLNLPCKIIFTFDK